jgi:hypothetical protein
VATPRSQHWPRRERQRDLPIRVEIAWVTHARPHLPRRLFFISFSIRTHTWLIVQIYLPFFLPKHGEKSKRKLQKIKLVLYSLLRDGFSSMPDKTN